MCVVVNSINRYHVCASRSESILASLRGTHHRISSLKRWRYVLLIFSMNSFYHFIAAYTHTQPFYCSSGIYLGPPGWSGTRKVKPRRLKPIWIYWSIVVFTCTQWVFVMISLVHSYWTVDDETIRSSMWFSWLAPRRKSDHAEILCQLPIRMKHAAD